MKLLFGALGALMFGAGVFTAVTMNKKPHMSELILANIEAMTYDREDRNEAPGR